MITFRDMKDAPLWLQWFSWFLILSFTSFIVILASTKVLELVPPKMLGLEHTPEDAMEWLRFPPFIFFFVVIWIGAGVAFYFKAPQETYDAYFYAQGCFTVILLMAFCMPYVSAPIDCAFDRVRVLHNLGKEDEAPDDVTERIEKKKKKSSLDLSKGKYSDANDAALDETLPLSTRGSDDLSEEPNTMPSTCEYETVAHWLEENPNASKEKIQRIYRAFNPETRLDYTLLGMKNCPNGIWMDLIEKAMNGEGPFVRTLEKPMSNQGLDLLKALAKDPRVPADQLRWILAAPAVDIHEEVFANPNATDDVKTEYDSVIVPFSQDTPDNKMLAARTVETKPYILAFLAWENDPLIRAAVSRNPNTPLSTVKKLLNDSDARVKKFAKAAVEERDPKRKRKKASSL